MVASARGVMLWEGLVQAPASHEGMTDALLQQLHPQAQQLTQTLMTGIPMVSIPLTQPHGQCLGQQMGGRWWGLVGEGGGEHQRALGPGGSQL